MIYMCEKMVSVQTAHTEQPSSQKQGSYHLNPSVPYLDNSIAPLMSLKTRGLSWQLMSTYVIW